MARADVIAAFQAYLAKIADDAESGIVAAIDQSADEMVELAQAACPVSVDLEKTPGELRASIQKIDGKDDLSKLVVADAKDAKGDYYGVHVEAGHRARNGEHVPAHAFFYPAWRLVRRDAKARINAALKAAIAKGG